LSALFFVVGKVNTRANWFGRYVREEVDRTAAWQHWWQPEASCKVYRVRRTCSECHSVDWR